MTANDAAVTTQASFMRASLDGRLNLSRCFPVRCVHHSNSQGPRKAEGAALRRHWGKPETTARRADKAAKMGYFRPLRRLHRPDHGCHKEVLSSTASRKYHIPERPESAAGGYDRMGNFKCEGI
jgi:hypothetical protein